jgi:hypothetical protein
LLKGAGIIPRFFVALPSLRAKRHLESPRAFYSPCYMTLDGSEIDQHGPSARRHRRSLAAARRFF